MLKLKDIFNIDISSKGGGKLYKKIMRKYNIPLKDVKEVKQEIVECSSGSGEGVKEYYYKVIGDGEMLPIFTGFIGIIHCITHIEENLYIKVHNVAGNYYKGLYDTDFLKNIIAFAITENATTIYSVSQDLGSPTSNIISIPKGNVNEKLKNLAESVSAPYEEVKSLFDATCQEITKEEYESMITYKP